MVNYIISPDNKFYRHSILPGLLSEKLLMDDFESIHGANQNFKHYLFCEHFHDQSYRFKGKKFGPAGRTYYIKFCTRISGVSFLNTYCQSKYEDKIFGNVFNVCRLPSTRLFYILSAMRNDRKGRLLKSIWLCFTFSFCFHGIVAIAVSFL